MRSEIALSFSKITICTQSIGKDILIIVEGGERAHIGTAVMAVPRPSLTGDGSVSVTVSVLNVIGHKDEIICRVLAENFAKKYNVTAVCTGGFHIDNISSGQIEEVIEAVQKFAV